MIEKFVEMLREPKLTESFWASGSHYKGDDSDKNFDHFCNVSGVPATKKKWGPKSAGPRSTYGRSEHEGLEKIEKKLHRTKGEVTPGVLRTASSELDHKNHPGAKHVHDWLKHLNKNGHSVKEDNGRYFSY